MFRKILLPVDGSEPAMRALRVGADVAGRYGAALTVLCVYRHHGPLESSLSMVRPSDPVPPDRALSDFAHEVVQAAAAELDRLGAVNVHTVVKRGHPARTIVAYARDNAIDLIVLGSRGLGDVEGFLLGSVSHKVTSLADCPCLTVK
ncbi:nucleotide-binding universal stress UspA family protein [Tepidamorphus gemmatus]|jgi:nucleotide-binding universal stress UspA family protein|uniref:Nucleotide-binding universal stress UspA family protein n=1 Tax=Tepidamorphus gemmatus TaxID=747076 RepID=A0A4R3LVH1_9HYPH|nr:universal stress protein [Tepidamorphus gemmatus]TCT04554.1 nucleotide-binding universal stress UspA family protein [Tepidamorphus gemmatus]